jgi:hypothetical protein
MLLGEQNPFCCEFIKMNLPKVVEGFIENLNMLMDTVSNKSCQQVFIKTVGELLNQAPKPFRKWQVLPTESGAYDSQLTEFSMGNHP